MASTKKVIWRVGLLVLFVLVLAKLHYNIQSPSHDFPAKSDCGDKMCSEFLTSDDVEHFQYCFRQMKLPTKINKYTCHFINSTKSPIALASFPGSGNTWVRGLLQDTTGICTGGVHCDTVLMRNGYPGEYIRSGVVLVVKTHQIDPRWTEVHYDSPPSLGYFKTLKDVPVYRAAIFLVRNPFDALVAEWHRRQTVNFSDNHVHTIGEEYFRDNKEWNVYVHQKAVKWQKTIFAWVVNNVGHPVNVIKYEDMKTNPSRELRRMLDFLQVSYTEAQFQRVVNNGYEKFKRHHSPRDDYDHYTSEQRAFVNSVIRTTHSVLEEYHLSETCNVYDYLAEELNVN